MISLLKRHRMGAATVALAFVASMLAPAAADEIWAADPGHSSAQFTVQHLVITRVVGTIPIKSATITTASATSTIPTSIEATLDPTNLDSKNANRDKDLRSPNFFDVDKYPTITFKSRKVTPAAVKDTFTVDGDLTIHGVTKPVSIPVQFVGQITDNRGRKHNAYTGTLKIKRDDYGMTFDVPIAGPLVAGHDVQIDLTVEATPKQ